MSDTWNSASPNGVVPTTAEALARLDMPLLDAMMTQRALRRLFSDPVDDAVVFVGFDNLLKQGSVLKALSGGRWTCMSIRPGRAKHPAKSREAGSCVFAMAATAPFETPMVALLRRSCIGLTTVTPSS